MVCLHGGIKHKAVVVLREGDVRTLSTSLSRKSIRNIAQNSLVYSYMNAKAYKLIWRDTPIQNMYSFNYTIILYQFLSLCVDCDRVCPIKTTCS